MRISKETIVYPLPTFEQLAKKESKWRLQLPQDYRFFILKYNGAVPAECNFSCSGHEYMVTRFLCILENVRESEFGWLDISVVESKIGERLTENEDLIGVEVLPIAELYSGDYLCLDFRIDKSSPSVCVWSHEESEDFSPVTYEVARSFTVFQKLLR